MITTLPSVESLTAFVKYSGTASVAFVKDGFVWLWTGINGNDSPDLKYVFLKKMNLVLESSLTLVYNIVLQWWKDH